VTKFAWHPGGTAKEAARAEVITVELFGFTTYSATDEEADAKVVEVVSATGAMSSVFEGCEDGGRDASMAGRE
jgi:hypothetical protein